MPRCVECSEEVARIVAPETQTVERCPHCGLSCDAYYEFGDAQRAVDVMLFKRRAWAHVLCNTPLTGANVALALGACLLEALAVRNLTALRALTPGQLATVFSHGPSLQLVRLRDVAPGLQATVPLFLCSVTEAVLVAAVTLWAGMRHRNAQETYQVALIRWLHAVCFAVSSKLVYLLFLVWCVPPSVLFACDGIFVFCLGCGFNTLQRTHSWSGTLRFLVVCLAARTAFRYFTNWTALFLA